MGEKHSLLVVGGWLRKNGCMNSLASFLEREKTRRRKKETRHNRRWICYMTIRVAKRGTMRIEYNKNVPGDPFVAMVRTTIY